jgi:hypothetical protein
LLSLSLSLCLSRNARSCQCALRANAPKKYSLLVIFSI